ncbi:MAG: NAD(P)H-dependent oxidoreductase [bacterium]|nr:NAD(P)H-dependent oxidoreductase [bacterium]
MKLTVFNGSPRGKNGNTEKMLESFFKGFLENNNNEYETVYLYKEKDKTRALKAFKDSEHSIVAFPLYFDAMPSGVKSFIESLSVVRDQKDKPGKQAKKRTMGYVVQSGFPEAHQSRFLERYLKKLASRLGAGYTGTIIKGAGIMLEIQPLDSAMNKKTLELFRLAGVEFGKTGTFDPAILKKIGSPEKIPLLMGLLIRLFIFLKIPFINGFWNKRLRKNNAFEKRCDRPYAAKS